MLNDNCFFRNTIIQGAKEFNIPEEYIRFLESFKHNGYAGEVELVNMLFLKLTSIL